MREDIERITFGKNKADRSPGAADWHGGRRHHDKTNRRQPEERSAIAALRVIRPIRAVGVFIQRESHHTQQHKRRKQRAGQSTVRAAFSRTGR